MHIEEMVLVVSQGSIDVATDDDDEGGEVVDLGFVIDGMGWETRQQVSLSIR